MGGGLGGLDGCAQADGGRGHGDGRVAQPVAELSPRGTAACSTGWKATEMLLLPIESMTRRPTAHHVARGVNGPLACLPGAESSSQAIPGRDRRRGGAQPAASSLVRERPRVTKEEPWAGEWRAPGGVSCTRSR